MTFKLGDTVEWASQAQGSWKNKRGEIVEVVPSGKCPTRHKVFGIPRNHESYVVMVGSKGYWPRVSGLKLSGQHEGSSKDIVDRLIRAAVSLREMRMDWSSGIMTDARHEIESLRASASGDARDARRYRALRDSGMYAPRLFDGRWSGWQDSSGRGYEADDLDAAADALIAAQEAGR